jgi:hypothetical protein
VNSQEINNKRRAFVFLPLILGTIFILLLGGVGAGIIKTTQEISKAVKEAQKLQEEKSYEEAVSKLEELENNFLVKYFGFKKDEITKLIEENSKLIEKIKKEELAEEKKEKEKKEEAGEEKAKEKEILDCKSSLDCLINCAQSCQPSKVEDRIVVKLGDWTADVLFLGEIKGEENGGCIFYVKAEKLYQLKKEGVGEEESQKETEKWRNFIEGAEELCFFEKEKLVEWLKLASEGVLPSFEGAECQYGSLEILQILQ